MPRQPAFELLLHLFKRGRRLSVCCDRVSNEPIHLELVAANDTSRSRDAGNRQHLGLDFSEFDAKPIDFDLTVGNAANSLSASDRDSGSPHTLRVRTELGHPFIVNNASSREGTVLIRRTSSRAGAVTRSKRFSTMIRRPPNARVVNSSYTER